MYSTLRGGVYDTLAIPDFQTESSKSRSADVQTEWPVTRSGSKNPMARHARAQDYFPLFDIRPWKPHRRIGSVMPEAEIWPRGTSSSLWRVSTSLLRIYSSTHEWRTLCYSLRTRLTTEMGNILFSNMWLANVCSAWGASSSQMQVIDINILGVNLWVSVCMSSAINPNKVNKRTWVLRHGTMYFI